MDKVKIWIISHKNTIIDIVLLISAFLSIITYLRFIPILIFIINFLIFKRHIKFSLIFFTIAVGLSIYFLIIGPKVDNDFKELTKKGFHQDLASESQKNLDLLAAHINEYKVKHGYLPKSLRDVQRNSTIMDVSYNLKDGGILDHPLYYYMILDSNNYFLSGIGRDGIPKTADDLIPNPNDAHFPKSLTE